MRHMLRTILFAAAAALPLAAAMTPVPAEAATLMVNSGDDEPDANPGDGNCRSTVTSRCTLRAAIMEANALAGPDAITLPSGTIRLTLSGTDNIGAVGDLDVTERLSITGPGRTLAIIDASGLAQRDRVFDVQQRAYLSLRGLRVTGGRAESLTTQGGQDGGGIRVQDWGQIDLSGIDVDNNEALSVGGGITVRTNGIAQIQGSTCVLRLRSERMALSAVETQ